ncbi:hypothetical protein PT974_05021 [Cladobotryum mycophilum]|uniref:SUN domain-containing protein n=1 Tax=Cladobotryum mycophilum TaxID=491253 RepID=A0ABR0SQU4_9HYPO
MEQQKQKQPSDSSPPPQPAIRRDNNISTRQINLSASTPLRPSTPPPSSQTSPNLWASEPTLRFPRPQGNTKLASWVSSSNPDIMHSEPTDDSGLAESTYEIISAANTDTEEQDDQYTESISESVGSLDFHRPDDVHSLAGTEHTYDEEESVPDDDDSYRAETPFQDEDDEEDDEEEDDMHEDTIMASQTSDAAVESLSDSEHEARSRCSLEYTQQSLGTPSLPTPEASRVLVAPPPKGFKANWNKKVKRFWEIETQIKDYVMEAASAALPGCMFILTFALILQLVHTPKQVPSVVPEASPIIAITTTTTTFTTTAAYSPTSTGTSTSTSTSTSSIIQPSPSSAGAVGLIPVGDVVSDEWLFGANKPAISFTVQSQHDILVHIPRKIKNTWQTKSCLTLTAKRDDTLVDTTMSSVDEGIIVKFAKKDVHGVVTLFLEATCRPKVHKVVKVHFGKGIMEGALEMTKSLAQDLSKLVPATAQEAERRLADAKRSLDSVCQNVCQNVQSASESVAKNVGATISETRQNLEDIASEAITQVKAAQQQVSDQLSEQLSKVQDFQNTLQLQLLDAQISAKLWWLQATGRQEEREDYQRKAKTFVAKKQAAAIEQSRVRRHLFEEQPAKPVPRPWWSRNKA